MTVKELKGQIKYLPDNMKVFIPVNKVACDYTEAKYTYVEKTTIEESEQYDDGKELIDVLFIDETP
jgi:hypothetical protein